MRLRGDGGQAVVEVILLTVILFVPLVWLLVTLSEVHKASLAATAAVREAGFEAARSATQAEAGRSIERAVDQALVDHGLPVEAARVRWTSSGFERGDRVGVEVSYPVTVLRVPFLGNVGGPAVWVNARHHAPVAPPESKL